MDQGIETEYRGKQRKTNGLEYTKRQICSNDVERQL